MAAAVMFTLAACMSPVFSQFHGGSLNDLMTLQALDIDIPEHAIRNAIGGRGAGFPQLSFGGRGQSSIGLGLGVQNSLHQAHLGGLSPRQTQLSLGQNLGGAQLSSSSNAGLLTSAGLTGGNAIGINRFTSQQLNNAGSFGQNSILQQQGINSGLNSHQQQTSLQRLSSNGGLASTQFGTLAGSQIGNLAGSQIGSLAGSQIGGLAGSQFGGLARSQVGGLASSQLGGSQLGVINGQSRLSDLSSLNRLGGSSSNVGTQRSRGNFGGLRVFQTGNQRPFRG